MKTVRLMFSIALLSLATVAVAQSDAHEHGQDTAAQKAEPQKPAAPKSEGQKSFEWMKSLAGEWQGSVTVNPPIKEMKGDTKLHATIRVLSRGNTIAHEFQEAGTPLDAKKYDHPLTMIYVNDDQQLNLIHYCDAGNRPRMAGKVSPDGKKVEFDFVDLTGPTKYGHMHHAVFTYIDENHHIEEWTYMLPGNKPMQARMELTRVSEVANK
jgi:hypothetical protein